MAFDHHIEADRIDDFNLFSAFVRVPLLILGGVLGGSKGSHPEDDDSNQKVHRRDDDTMDCSSDYPSTQSTAVSYRREELRHQSQYTTNPPSCIIVSDEDMEESDDLGSLTRSKKMSWSDESGLSLVQYNDEVSSYEPTSITHNKIVPSKPVKSALKRAHPFLHYSQRDGGSTSNEDACTRYLPKMAGKGMIMPTRPYGGSHKIDETIANGSETSPQWGWYINTTPPTPEMYYSNNSSSAKFITNKTTTKTATTTLVQASSNGKRCQNQVFQNLQSSNTPMGWTSVPI